MKQFLLIFCLFTHHSAFCQKISEADSLLQRKYYHRILPVHSKNDLLYYGIDNSLTLQYPDEASKKLKFFLKTHNGMIFESDSGYLTIPRNAGRAFISIYIVTNKDTISIGKKEFTVLQVPIPTIKIGSVVIKDQVAIDRSIFFKKDSLKVFFTDDIRNSDNWCKAEYFNLGYAFGGRYISVDNKGALFTNSALEMIAKMKSNQDVVIKVMSISCSQIFKHLPLVRFKIK
jgi:hypothetical protein